MTSLLNLPPETISAILAYLMRTEGLEAIRRFRAICLGARDFIKNGFTRIGHISNIEPRVIMANINFMLNHCSDDLITSILGPKAADELLRHRAKDAMIVYKWPVQGVKLPIVAKCRFGKYCWRNKFSAMKFFYWAAATSSTAILRYFAGIIDSEAKNMIFRGAINSIEAKVGDKEREVWGYIDLNSIRDAIFNEISDVELIAKKGRLNIIKYIHDNSSTNFIEKITVIPAMEIIIKNNYCHILEWIFNNDPDRRALHAACILVYGNKTMFYWWLSLFNQPGLKQNDELRECEDPCQSVEACVNDLNEAFDDGVKYQIIINGHLWAIKWLHENGYDIRCIDARAIVGAIKCNHIKIIFWLGNHGYNEIDFMKYIFESFGKTASVMAKAFKYIIYNHDVRYNILSGFCPIRGVHY